MRDRWHNALKNVNEGIEIDPDSVKVHKATYAYAKIALLTQSQIRNAWLYAFDAEADTMRRWNEVSAKVVEELQSGSISPLFGTTASSQTTTVMPQVV